MANRMKVTRGIRNNNPCNIRHGSRWVGLRPKQTDKGFCQFTSMEYGVRAALRTLMTYVNKHHLTSVRDIIYRWSPPEDNNNTVHYIRIIEDALDREELPHEWPRGYLTKQKLKNDPWWFTFMKAMCKHESGYILTKGMYDLAVSLL